MSWAHHMNVIIYYYAEAAQLPFLCISSKCMVLACTKYYCYVHVFENLMISHVNSSGLCVTVSADSCVIHWFLLSCSSHTSASAVPVSLSPAHGRQRTSTTFVSFSSLRPVQPPAELAEQVFLIFTPSLLVSWVYWCTNGWLFIVP